MERTWGATLTGSLLGVALLLALLQALVLFKTATTAPQAALGAPAPAREAWPRQVSQRPAARPRLEQRDRPAEKQPEPRPLPRQFRGVVPEPGPKPLRRSAA